MKRRTRLRKLGLAPEPPPKKKTRGQALLEIAEALAAELRRQNLPPVHLTNLNVIEDCRRWGVETTVTCLRQFGDIPSNVRWRLGRP